MSDYRKQYDTVYETIKKWLYEKGAKLEKKHGDWITLYAPKNQVIIMDSYNGQISQAHCKDTLVSNGFSLDGNYSVHSHATPTEHKYNITHEDLEEAVDIYKTLLTIPS